MAELTPMMKQYFEIKNKNRDFILFYRLGDFYEMFFDDAKTASRELELTLTGRDCGQEERAPMCGVPFHSAEGYIAKLVRKGFKVAICEQVEDPKTAKGLVRREIVRRVTPGTVVDASMLDEQRNNFLGCVYAAQGQVGVCFADITTGEVYATGSSDWNDIASELGRFAPREVLIGGEAAVNDALQHFLTDRLEALVEPMPEDAFDMQGAAARIEARFGVTDLVAAGLDDLPLTTACLGGLLSYLEQTQQSSLANLNHLQVYLQGQYMELDLIARRNLELCETMRTKEKKGTLLWVLDRTKTAMGARLMRQWIEKPLHNPLHINRRQQAVGALCDDVVARSALADALKKVFDMERLIGRVVYGTANCRDLRALHAAICCLPEVRAQASLFGAQQLRELTGQIDLLEDVRALIELAIVEEPPITLREGGLIQRGYHNEIDHLRDLASGGKGEIAAIEQQEREKTGISKLKISYNRVFGYYIEVSKSNADLVPEHYIRKQTLANCERYITEELKKLESTVLGAQERLTTLEYEVFVAIRDRVAAEVHRVQRTAQALAGLDVLCALAQVASDYHYVCPTVDFSGRIDIRDGRHPVVERILKDNLFIPNDTVLDNGENRVSIITGPNMAGKSTYMRQVALITIMAQIGSFVPAASAHIGVADRVFTRVGASDDLASGQSTFMVEMSEVAEILKNATKSSLLILDEIGRGTSTYDGMSIARAVIEYVADPKKVGARALFATHYHELTVLEDMVSGVKNYNIAVKKRGDDITFLRKIVRGGADDSFGIEVAKLAGIPAAVIKRAKSVLADLEANTPRVELRVVEDEDVPQITMNDLSGGAVADRLRAMQIDTMTPIEALNALFELKKLI
ncbi:DNA mismatch repair protein MutS [Butyricicoccus sp. Marseille-Q5471]|uniref:DNA mismatch repair protein MutS n=1 Tax=Butyricicoccus sp. Marseille-Q5471 TaxID=3039493 RepID=UPI0024BD08CC|nr:DNA mismatch repair protein MutS [Butyricicoccus sp. Marseille-Q5471]